MWFVARTCARMSPGWLAYGQNGSDQVNVIVGATRYPAKKSTSLEFQVGCVATKDVGKRSSNTTFRFVPWA